MSTLDSPIALLYFLVEWTIRLGALFVVPLRRPPTAAAAWLLLLFFLPIVGLVMYLLIGRPNISRDRNEKTLRLAETLRPITDYLERTEPQSSGDLPARF